MIATCLTGHQAGRKGERGERRGEKWERRRCEGDLPLRVGKYSHLPYARSSSDLFRIRGAASKFFNGSRTIGTRGQCGTLSVLASARLQYQNIPRRETSPR